jgi:hypothetical protein
MNKISVNGGITLVNSRFTGYREKVRDSGITE